MGLIELEKQDLLRTAIKSHKRTLREAEWHEASLVRTPVEIEPPYPIEGVDCECGGTFDADEACSDCDQGHDDHDLNSCFACFERAVGRAEAAAEGMER